MTLELVEAALGEREWPAPYELEDCLPDGILVAFPRCHLLFIEGVVGDSLVKFLPRDTHWPSSLTLIDALRALRFDPGLHPPPPTPELPDVAGAPPSLEKLRVSLRNACTLLLTYLRPCLLGDFGWVETYRLMRANEG